MHFPKSLPASFVDLKQVEEKRNSSKKENKKKEIKDLLWGVGTNQ